MRKMFKQMMPVHVTLLTPNTCPKNASMWHSNVPSVFAAWWPLSTMQLEMKNLEAYATSVAAFVKMRWKLAGSV